MNSTTYFLNLGCNSGARLSTLKRAIAKLGQSTMLGEHCTHPIAVDCTSRAWEGQECSTPFAPYINVGLAISTAGPLDNLGTHCRFIEHLFGRRRDPERNLPVPLDIDIIASERNGSIRVHTEKNITHAHCLVPLWEVATPAFGVFLASAMREQDVTLDDLRNRLWLMAEREDLAVRHPAEKHYARMYA